MRNTPGRRLLVAVLASLGLVISTGSLAHSAPERDLFPCGVGNGSTTARYCDLAAGDLVEISLAELRPTQPSLGHDEVFYKLGRYTLGKDAVNKRFDDWCEANGQREVLTAQPAAKLSDPATFTCAVPVGSETPQTTGPMKTAVVGPGGQLYLTDGHHTFTSFWETPDGGPNLRVRVRITGNLSGLNPAAFWQTMQEKGWTWLRDAADRPISPHQLPQRLGLSEFGDDRYRAALYFARDIGFSQDADSPAFQEFYWGRWLRAQSDPAVQPDHTDRTDLGAYLTLIRSISTAIVALDNGAQVSDGHTAESLGKLSAFDSKEFAKLSRPYTDDKPGKLAYALQYKNAR
ncbi:lipoprotein [Nocardia neocaledoniensis NBRC 108232]|uniref:ParB-like nuclease n=1 Tax=Nocardia neocaledoniensis TaxID=236511 RepID=A0A317NB71_9NOCA|nr:ParB/Srx family N-terminal domain-containing protein [Nocardia neocaledoniensis]PWV72310.1 hypothetical protein DFR69_109227 [Nocardia neocaledoniensis]GEM33645.1 lipoprotein [Nocardia neocaledoniensis NBRC 108232]